MPPFCEKHQCWHRILPNGRCGCPECAREKERPQMTKAERIAQVLHWESERPFDWPEELRADCQWIRDRYNALKWKTSFSEASDRARAEWVERVLEENENGYL